MGVTEVLQKQQNSKVADLLLEHETYDSQGILSVREVNLQS